MVRAKILHFTAFIFAMVSFEMPSPAGQIETSDSSIVWQAGIDGVEIEWAPDGSFNRIYSRFLLSTGGVPGQEGSFQGTNNS